MPAYSGMWTLSQVAQAIKNLDWTGVPPTVVEYLIVAGGGGGGGDNGAQQTGGGGGSNGSGGLATYPNLLGGAGGSGIVIIRYPRNLAPPAGTTDNPQILYNSGYQIYIWTTSGTITF